MNRPAGHLAYLWLLLSLGGPVAACGLIATLETPAGLLIPLESETITTVAPWALHTLVLTIPVTDCFRFLVQVAVDGKPWDNRAIQSLQPMAPLVFAEDYGVFALTASAMFRATDRGEHTITVVYQDETLESPRTYIYRFRVGA